MVARMRAWWTDTPAKLHLDNCNTIQRMIVAPHIPHATLLRTAFGNICSLIVEHKLTDEDLLRRLHRQRHFPMLQRLVLSTPDPEAWGPLPFIFDPIFTTGLPVIEAPELTDLHLCTLIVHLPDTSKLSKLHLSSRSRRRDHRPRPRTWNKWPAALVHDLIVRNSSLTILYLIEALRHETLDDYFTQIDLPSLRELVVCCPNERECTWVLDYISFPPEAYIAFHIGHRATAEFDDEQFYFSLGLELRRRAFTSITAVASFNLSGVLLSPDARIASDLPAYDETEALLHTSEIAHAKYHAVPGAVDVFISYSSSHVPVTTWEEIYHNMSPYISEDDIRINTENSQLLDNTLSLAAEFHIFIEELRLWSLGTEGCIWESLVRGLTGWSLGSDEGGDEPIANDIVELLLAMYPDTTCIYDCRTGNGWEAESTTELVEGLYGLRRMVV
ncbi:unnamed protein product [Peniophora sp. CBMAI 1063]|nr:unnamed protein product [Peniophora sp. CBMAI 1063]